MHEIRNSLNINCAKINKLLPADFQGLHMQLLHVIPDPLLPILIIILSCIQELMHSNGLVNLKYIAYLLMGSNSLRFILSITR